VSCKQKEKPYIFVLSKNFCFLLFDTKTQPDPYYAETNNPREDSICLKEKNVKELPITANLVAFSFLKKYTATKNMKKDRKIMQTCVLRK